MRAPIQKKLQFNRIAAIMLAAAGTSSYSLAQDADESPRLEEVIVTAQKRQESLQKVPISVVAIGGEKLDTGGIENLDDLTTLLPNIHFTETGFSTQVRVRGIGSDNSQGFEQSVGMYIDGIYHGRAQLFRLPMMDMQRVELLRGPQSTLFGKNSIAGALNLTTARPTEEFQGGLTVSHEFEHQQNEVNAYFSGALSDDFRARLAVRGYTEDGYFQNSFTGEDESSADENSVRLSLDFTPSDDLSIFVKVERNEFETVGRNIEITQDIPQTSGGATYNQQLLAFSQPSLDSTIDYVRQIDQQEFSDNIVNNVTFQAEYALGDYTVTSITGILDFKYSEFCDCDYTAAQIIDLDLNEEYDQFSQELRIASPQGETIDWLAGVFYQKWDQTFADAFSIQRNNILPPLLAAASSAGPIALTLADSGVRRDFEQGSSALAAFAQTTLNMGDRWHLTLGGRLTKEDKDATKAINVFQPTTGELVTDPARAATLGALYLAVFRVESEQAVVSAAGQPLAYGGHNVSGERSETEFNPLINLEFDISDDILVYGSATTGFKAGGFDPRSNSVGNFARPTSQSTGEEANPSLFFEFEEEEALALEQGMKTRLADGRLELNYALFWTKYDDLQISQFDGGVGFNAGNANETTVQGLEVDGRWAISDQWNASYGFSYLDFEYNDFKNGNCAAGQTPDGVSIDGSTPTCDNTGKRGVYTPDYTINTSLNYRNYITRNIELTGFVDVQHVDGHNVHVNLDPRGEIDPYTLVSLRLGLETENWSVAVLGKNLLDEYIVSYSANAPLSDSQLNTNTFYSAIRRPRTVAIEGSVRF